MEILDLITEKYKKSPVTEAFRTLRTNIKFASVKEKVQTIMFTSAVSDEGKTTICGNLAVVLAQSGQKVLIIDCDMRNPSQHKIFSLSIRGLSNCLVAGDGSSRYIQKTSIPNVDLLAAGPVAPNPSELLSSVVMIQLMQQVREKYDYVFLDSPPVMPVTDAQILSSLSDGVILVISSRVISPAVGREVKQRLQQVGANILGVVLNKIEAKNSYCYKYYYDSIEQNSESK